MAKRKKNFRDIVQAAWGADTQLSAGTLADKLVLLHKRLHMWDSSVLKRKRKKLRSTQRELERVTRDAMTEENLAQQKELSIEIEKFLEQEELYWSQRGHVDWLKFGDRNTEYFHHSASARRQRNKIKGLKDDNGILRENIGEINPMISSYFSGLFSTEVDDVDPLILDKVVPRVTTDMNEALNKPYTADDVRKALFSIGDLKAPGTYGLHAIFFKKCWHIIGDSLCNEVLLAINDKVE